MHDSYQANKAWMMVRVIPAQGLWGSKLRPTAHYPDVMSHNPTIVLSPLDEATISPSSTVAPNYAFLQVPDPYPEY